MDTLPELLFSEAAKPAQSRRVLRLAEEGKVRKLAPGIYTSNLTSTLESIVLRKWPEIVGHLVPGSVVSHRSAFDAKPNKGRLTITRPGTRRKLDLPGLSVDVMPGTGPVVEGPARDMRFIALYISSEPRRFLENFTRGRGWAERVLSAEEMEGKLEQLLNLRGEGSLGELRDSCRSIAEVLHLEHEFARLDRLIGTLLGTRDARLASAPARARAAGRPYDSRRVELFTTMFETLNATTFHSAADPARTPHAKDQFAFFEAYFSNYIEGTRFTVEEAEEIVFEGKIIPNRDADSHDVLGTYEAATRSPWRDRPPEDVDRFLDWLRSTHAQIMSRRPAMLPGQWKDRVNQAGTTMFVVPELVPGTLREGFARMAALADPLARAMMMMIIVSEVHPFNDGNGRTARLAMNSILSESDRCRIIVPTMARGDYLMSLKAFSHNAEQGPFIEVMRRLSLWSAQFDYDQPLPDLKSALEARQAFETEVSFGRLALADLHAGEESDVEAAAPNMH